MQFNSKLSARFNNNHQRCTSIQISTPPALSKFASECQRKNTLTLRHSMIKQKVSFLIKNISSPQNRKISQKENEALDVETYQQDNIKEIIKENNKKKLREEQQETKIKKELKELQSERERLKKSLIVTTDATSENILSQKVSRLNEKINRIMRIMRSSIANPSANENDENEIKQKDNQKPNNVSAAIKKKDKHSIDESINSLSHSKIASECSPTNYRDNTNKIGSKKLKKECKGFKANFGEDEDEQVKKLLMDNQKISQIILGMDLLEQKKKIEKHRKVRFMKQFPNFCFVRKNRKYPYYQPCTAVTLNDTNKGLSHLLFKSYKPDGFRALFLKDTEGKLALSDYEGKDDPKYGEVKIPETIDDIINDINDREIKSASISRIASRRTSAKNTARGNESTKPTTLITQMGKPRPKSGSIQSMSHRTSCHPQEIKRLCVPRSRKLREDFLKLITSGKIIDDSIKDVLKGEKKHYKKSDYDSLLKLYDVTGQDKQRDFLKRRSPEQLDDEDKMRSSLEKIPEPAKSTFREAKKKMLYEDKLLNKNIKENAYNLKLKHLKMQHEFRKVAWETMFMTGQNVDDGKDMIIKDPFKNLYSNIDNLQWLITKKNILKKTKPKGLWLPKETNRFSIWY